MTITRIYSKTRIEFDEDFDANNVNSAEDRIEEWIKLNLGIKG